MDTHSRFPLSGSPQQQALAYVEARSHGGPLDPTLRVTVNFHPASDHRGVPLLRRFAEDGEYRSQFETGTGNGSLSAHPGGERWHWENRLFGGAYDVASDNERPKVGALNYARRATGAAPRFGSAHLRLRTEIAARSTFCYPDASFDPSSFGTATRMSLVDLAAADVRDNLDDYIEAHVHGPLRLATDVEALVLDPCFRDTEVQELALRLPCALEWHPGFRLHVDEMALHPAYRGPEYVALGRSLAVDGWLTPAIIELAVRTERHHPQDLKKVWHYLARFGDRSAG
ncbi:MAG: DUF3626 domain-containing protein [Gemmatimonadota bacterium]